VKIETTKAFLIKKSEYEDASLISIFFTQKEGKISTFAKSAQKSKKRFGYTIDFFNELLIEYKKKEQSNLYLLTSCRINNPFKNIKLDIKKFACASFFTEIIYELCAHSEHMENIYELFYDFLSQINENSNSFKILVNYTINFLKKMGYFPVLTECNQCKTKASSEWYYNFSEGDLLCVNCKTNKQNIYQISPIILSIIHGISLKNSNDYLSALAFLNKIITYNINKDLNSFEFLSRI
jgi:DNA repair protein RecO (recombination protein O)